jgi:hypothetical protein
VELAGIVYSAAIATGTVAGAWLLWLIKKSWFVSLAGLIAGAALGFLVAHVLSHVLYRTVEGHTTVVRVGAAALSSTIPAGLAGGVTTGVAVAAVLVLLFGAKTKQVPTASVSLGCGFALGILFPCLGSLL